MRYHEHIGRLCPHGIMFHHFHDESRFYRSEGSISAADFQSLIDYVGRENILSPQDWEQRAAHGTLSATHVCFTFDDSLRCQFEIALPVLNRNGIKAFFFVYSSVFEGCVERLETFRYLRNACYPSLEDFYSDFYEQAAQYDLARTIEEGLKDFPGEEYLADFPFYTLGDRKYRFVRDRILTTAHYNQIVDGLMSKKLLDLGKIAPLLWMGADDLRELTHQGHVVGLHSYSHPMNMSGLSPAEQEKEYSENFTHLQRELEVSPWAMSHPRNSYNADTIGVLRKLGIRVGFCANLKYPGRQGLEFPREDHSTIFKEVR